jgi:hypothetical protein
MGSNRSLLSSAASSSDDEIRRETPPAAMERPSNPIPWNGDGRKSAWMEEDIIIATNATTSSTTAIIPTDYHHEFQQEQHIGFPSYQSISPEDAINPATSTPTIATTSSSINSLEGWTIEEAGGVTDHILFENQKQIDRSVRRIVELAMDADISGRKEEQETDNNEREETTEGLWLLPDYSVLEHKLDRAYGMMCNLNDHELLYLPGVFKVLMRACLSHQQIDRALDIYNKSLTCGVVVSDHEFKRLCNALESHGRSDEVDHNTPRSATAT